MLSSKTSQQNHLSLTTGSCNYILQQSLCCSILSLEAKRSKNHPFFSQPFLLSDSSPQRRFGINQGLESGFGIRVHSPRSGAGRDTGCLWKRGGSGRCVIVKIRSERCCQLVGTPLCQELTGAEEQEMDRRCCYLCTSTGN